MLNQIIYKQSVFFRRGYLIFLLFSTNILFAQDMGNIAPFSNFDFGVYGGINFENFSEQGGVFYIEGKTNLTSNLNLKLALGYYKSTEQTNYTLRNSGGPYTIDTITYYSAREEYITEKVYDVLPISFGLQYIFRNKRISPYILLDGSYNYIDTKRTRNGGRIWTYETYEDIPNEFKDNQTETFPNKSFGVALGIGTIYNIKNNLNLDFRYLFKYDNEIVNSHQLLIGFSF